jgi:hypothetical protein
MYTYESDGEYKPYNDIVVNYIQRAMPNIRAAQYNIISEYASTCISDIASCYNQQITQINAWSSNANIASIRNIMQGACRNIALTCGYAIYQSDDTDTCNTESASGVSGCIEAVSQMFYQSLLCPDNSTYTGTPGLTGQSSYVNTHCVCNAGYTPYGNACVACPENSTYTTTVGTVGLSGYVLSNCVCNSGYEPISGDCKSAS